MEVAQDHLQWCR